VLHGKLDLAQAEAVGDLVDARTDAMRDAAVRQLDGGLSRPRRGAPRPGARPRGAPGLRRGLSREDDGPVARGRVLAAADAVLAAVAALLATVPAGEIVRDGAVVVLAGPPNAGKSALFNALAGEARALVSDVPGTTRDALEVVVEPPALLGGRPPWPLRLVDTAGLRDAADPVERLGLDVGERWLRRAHVVAACGETVEDVARTAAHVAARTAAPVLGVWTKADLRVAVPSSARGSDAWPCHRTLRRPPRRRARGSR
jgi:tRNA modification GTPase